MKKKTLSRMEIFKIVILCCALIIIAFRVFVEYAAKKKGLYLLHDYMYGVINYSILILLAISAPRNKKIKILEYSILAILLVLNTKGFKNHPNNPVFLSYSPNKENVVVIKETADPIKGSYGLKKSHYIFFRVVDKYFTYNQYRTFSNGTYKVHWVNDNIAKVTYLTGESNKVAQHITNFKPNGQAYTNVLGSLQGKWHDKNNSQNKLEIKGGMITLEKGGQTYFYDAMKADEQGNYGTVIYDQYRDPNFSIIKNEDGTILVGDVTLDKPQEHTYVRNGKN